MNYPYYVIPDIEAFREATGEERERLAGRIAALVSDRTALCEILGLEPEENNQQEEAPGTPELSTDATIDSFLDRFGSPMSGAKENPEEIVPLPPADYDLSRIEADPIILPENPAAGKPAAENIPEEKTEPTPESMARILIKRGDYAKALEIITDLSLNNPKKSIYFADQIRFLKKLILNQSKSKKT